jgi:hypothetical protein
MATFSIKEQLNLLDTATRELAIKKHDQLKTVLDTTYHLPLRDDSRLAWTYISELPESEVSAIARELWNTKILYEFTPYSEICKDILPLVKKELIEHRHMDPQKAWEHIQHFIIPYIQLDCMETCMEKYAG